MDFFLNSTVIMPTALGGTTVIVNPVYEAKGVFSLNASYELQGSLWMTKDGQRMPAVLLGNASYLLRDKNGAAVGISQSGIAPDVNGLFKTTPVNANAISDLTHYTIEVTIVADGVGRTAVLGLLVGE
jgi:hypothetical protein